MVSTNYATAAALCMQSESPVLLPTHVPAGMWQPTVVAAPKTRTTGVFAAASTGLKSIHVDSNPASREAKQAAPPRGRFR